MTTAPQIERAYRGCEEITRREAANFFYGIRLLPRAKRQAMSAVYAFARRVDDIGDGSLPVERKLVALQAERARLDTVSHGLAHPSGNANGHAGGALDPVMVALADACARFSLPVDALQHLVDGVELDVRGTRYDTFEELVVYCRHVAGSIGRLCVAIFGTTDAATADMLADDLGVAMQLTNILRDVREDKELGRVYLPAEDLQRFGVSELCADAAVSELIRFEAARNREWFDRGLQLVGMLDARSASCVLAMTGIYRRILELIEQEPSEVMRRRISVPVWEKAWLAARSLTGARSSAAAARPTPTGARA